MIEEYEKGNEETGHPKPEDRYSSTSFPVVLGKIVSSGHVETSQDILP